MTYIDVTVWNLNWSCSLLCTGTVAIYPTGSLLCTGTVAMYPTGSLLCTSTVAIYTTGSLLGSETVCGGGLTGTDDV